MSNVIPFPERRFHPTYENLRTDDARAAYWHAIESKHGLRSAQWIAEIIDVVATRMNEASARLKERCP